MWYMISSLTMRQEFVCISARDIIPSGLQIKIVPSLLLFLRVKHLQIFIITLDLVDQWPALEIGSQCKLNECKILMLLWTERLLDSVTLVFNHTGFSQTLSKHVECMRNNQVLLVFQKAAFFVRKWLIVHFTL